MKKILVPVDFSELSDNAVNYAVALARHSDAELFFINVFYVPVIAYNAALLLPTTHEFEKQSIENFEKMKQSILKVDGQLKTTYYYTQGNAVDEINMYAILKEIDLIVIGAQGAGYIEERIFGNTASALMHSGVASILVIGKEMKFRKPEKIVLAVDYAETDHNTTLKPLKQLVSLFGSHVCVLNVITGSNVSTSDEISESYKLAHALKHIPHTFFHTQEDEVAAGINAFVKSHDIHMAVMIARSHSVLSRILHEPQTKKMVFHSEVPLLVLHEQKT